MGDEERGFDDRGESPRGEPESIDDTLEERWGDWAPVVMEGRGPALEELLGRLGSKVHDV